MNKHDQMFFGLIMQYQQLAMMAMGKLARPEGGMRLDLQEATIFIDMLECIQAKTKGNLSADEQRYLDSTLADLKLNFVEESGKPKVDAPKTEETPAGEDVPKDDA